MHAGPSERLLKVYAVTLVGDAGCAAHILQAQYAQIKCAPSACRGA